jgi:predicted deacylase
VAALNVIPGQQVEAGAVLAVIGEQSIGEQSIEEQPTGEGAQEPA